MTSEIEIASIRNLTTNELIHSHVCHGLGGLVPSKLQLNRRKETFRSGPDNIDLGLWSLQKKKSLTTQSTTGKVLQGA